MLPQKVSPFLRFGLIVEQLVLDHQQHTPRLVDATQAVAQSHELGLDVEEVRSSIPLASTIYRCRSRWVLTPGVLLQALGVGTLGSRRAAMTSCVIVPG
jgi:hypothetical protein